MRKIILIITLFSLILSDHLAASNKRILIEEENEITRGYVILQANKSFAEQVKRPNTTYEIRYYYDLKKETIVLPEGCVLKFSGGLIDNGTIKGNLSFIDASDIQIFGTNLLLTGYWGINSINVCWFGAKNDISYNSTKAFKAANESAWNISNKKIEYEYYGETRTIRIYIPTGVYYVSGDNILGSIRDEDSFPNYNTNSRYRVEGNNSILYWDVAKKDNVLFRFDYSLGHQSVSDLKVFVVNNTKEDYAGVVFKIGNKAPNKKAQGRIYADASAPLYSNLHVVNSRKGKGGVYKVFDVIGDGMCDQALVQRCTFEDFYYCFYNINPEAVLWNFESCCFFTTANNACYFYFTSLNQYFTVNNSSFSYCDGQTLCEYNCDLNDKKKLLGNDRNNIIISNSRFEGFLRNNKDWFLVFRGTAGKLILENTNFDASSSYNIIHQFLLSDVGSVQISNCAMSKALFTLPKYTPRSFGLGDQNNWAIVSDNLRCDNIVIKGYDWDKNRIIDITETYLSKGIYYRYADFKDLRGKSAHGYKLQSFFLTPNTKGEVQFEEKSFTFIHGNTSTGNSLLLPPFCVVRKIDLLDKGTLPSNVSKIRIYAGERKNGVYTDVPISNSLKEPLKTIFEGSIVVFDENIDKQTLYCSYITDQGKEVSVNSGSLRITYTPLTDPSTYSIKGPSAVIIKK